MFVRTFPFSTSLVIMAITRTSSCQIIRQKSSFVFERQPCAAMYVLSFTVIRQLIELRPCVDLFFYSFEQGREF